MYVCPSSAVTTDEVNECLFDGACIVQPVGLKRMRERVAIIKASGVKLMISEPALNSLDSTY